MQKSKHIEMQKCINAGMQKYTHLYLIMHLCISAFLHFVAYHHPQQRKTQSSWNCASACRILWWRHWVASWEDHTWTCCENGIISSKELVRVWIFLQHTKYIPADITNLLQRRYINQLLSYAYATNIIIIISTMNNYVLLYYVTGLNFIRVQVGSGEFK